MTLTDHDLIHRVRADDTEAFEALFARYQEAIARYVAATVRDRAAAEDLTQEVFLRVWTRAEQWDGRGAFKAWLFRIATNLALNHLRSVRRRREQPLDVPASTVGDEDEGAAPGWMIDAAAPAPDAALEQSERGALLRQLIDGLPAEKRAVFRLVHEEEMDIRDVADALGIPEGTVKSRLHYARKRLARAWQEIETEWQGL